MKRDPFGYHKLTDGARFRLELDRPLLLACCGCGLVHKFNFRLLDKAGRLVIAISRDETETRKQRLLTKPKKQ